MAFVVMVPRFQSTGSIAVVHRLSCSMSCGIFLDQGSNLCLLHLQVDSLPLSHQGSPVEPVLRVSIFLITQKQDLHLRMDIGKKRWRFSEKRGSVKWSWKVGDENGCQEALRTYLWFVVMSFKSDHSAQWCGLSPATYSCESMQGVGEKSV